MLLALLGMRAVGGLHQTSRQSQPEKGVPAGFYRLILPVLIVFSAYMVWVGKTSPAARFAAALLVAGGIIGCIVGAKPLSHASCRARVGVSWSPPASPCFCHWASFPGFKTVSSWRFRARSGRLVDLVDRGHGTRFDCIVPDHSFHRQFRGSARAPGQTGSVPAVSHGRLKNRYRHRNTAVGYARRHGAAGSLVVPAAPRPQRSRGQRRERAFFFSWSPGRPAMDWRRPILVPHPWS